MQVTACLTLQRFPARPLARGLQYFRQACHRLAIVGRVGCNGRRQVLSSCQATVIPAPSARLLSIVENFNLAHISTLYVSKMRRQSSKEDPSL
jgi:hypothetical protein